MSANLVSIIMPAYNAEKYIAASIRSVIAQTYSEWELIVVDDGSTDSTATVVQEFVSRDSRIKYIFQENGQPGKARNTGIVNSSGPLIAFLDSDDLWIEKKLERQTRALAENNADVVFSDAYIFKGDDTTDETKAFRSPAGRFSGRDILDSLIIANRIPVLTVLLKRTALDRVGLFEEEKAYQGVEDYDLWLRLAQAGVVFYGLPSVLARYRQHDTATSSVQSKIYKPMLLVVKKYIDRTRLDESEKKKRITGLYRELISVLIDEGKISEAKTLIHELAEWNRKSIVTKLQKLLIRILPQQYNFISRECLYRTEWHLQNRFGRGKHAH